MLNGTQYRCHVVVAGSDRFADDLLAEVAARPARETPLLAIRNALVPVLEAALAKSGDARRHPPGW